MRRTLVYGPAYLDHVVRVDRPLMDGATFDGSADGRLADPGSAPRLRDRSGRELRLDGLQSSPVRPFGRVDLETDFPPTFPVEGRSVGVLGEGLDLGGMGAGYAAAFGGTLISALGPEGDPIGDRVAELLALAGIAHRPIRVPDRPSDWTLIVSSGRFGDKLAVGFRGCHAAVRALETDLNPVDLLVVAALPNALLAQALEHPAPVKFLAPARRNVRGGSPSLAELAGRYDILCCNRGEWEEADDPARILATTPIVVVTDGPAGCRIAFRDPRGRPATIAVPAYPRDDPPKDTNRAGEAFASAFVTVLLDSGWTPGVADPHLIATAGRGASAAAALVLDREDFGFPTQGEIDAALAAGRVAGGAAARSG